MVLDITAVETRASYGITQFYLPQSRSDVSAITPAEAGTCGQLEHTTQPVIVIYRENYVKNLPV